MENAVPNTFREQLAAQREADWQQSCPTCGLTRRALYERGLLGCARCYQTFAAEVKRGLQEIHGATEHYGKP